MISADGGEWNGTRRRLQRSLRSGLARRRTCAARGREAHHGWSCRWGPQATGAANSIRSEAWEEVRGCRCPVPGVCSSQPPVPAGVEINAVFRSQVPFKTRIYSAPDGSRGQEGKSTGRGALAPSVRRRSGITPARRLPASHRDPAGQENSPGDPRGPLSGPTKTGSS
jgi:hypothetical protein